MDLPANSEAIRAALDAAGELVLPLDGSSMGPRWSRAGAVRAVSLSRRPADWGNVVLIPRSGRIYAHRLIFRWRGWCWTKGDARLAWDRPAVLREDLLGVVVALVPEDGRPVSSRGRALFHLLLALAAWPFLGLVRRVRRIPESPGMR
ncbi:MAG TPA: hypothetical protein PKE12_13475 [Kiritimatiellia bacterium]|nr:hypothetical protein [Kiritimatiellia bacterium]